MLLEVYCVYLWFSRRECFLRKYGTNESSQGSNRRFEKAYLTIAYREKNIKRLKSSAALRANKAR